MSRIPWSIDLLLLIVAAVTLASGGVCMAFGLPSLARIAWLAGTLPILLALTVSLAKAVARRQAGIDVLAWLAIGLAIVLDETLTAAVIALMLASGRALEQYAQHRAQREMTALLGRAPRRATRFENGEWRSVALETIVPGDRLLVRSGEFVPVDGTLSDDAELDESMLTGESSTQSRRAGESACSGVVNVGAPFEMVARTTAGDSTFAGIVRMVERAQRERSPSVRLADRYAALFVLASLFVAGLSWLMTGDVARALAVLVVATPCPLILAVPVAIVSGMSRCSRRGVLVKGGGALERLAQASILFFDKTGTLTGGQARIVSIECGGGIATDDVLRWAASLAQASGHVISDALTIAARERGIDLSPPSGVVETAGEGVTGRVDDRTVAIGKFEYVSARSTVEPWSDAFLRRIAAEGGAAVFVGVDGVMTGAIQMADQLRLETPRALRLLKREGVERLVMLTGDRRDIAQAVGELLGVTDVRAEQTPTDKLAAIEAARKDGVTIMVGDGVNDAPALAAADVGIAMGARGGRGVFRSSRRGTAGGSAGPTRRCDPYRTTVTPYRARKRGGGYVAVVCCNDDCCRRIPATDRRCGRSGSHRRRRHRQCVARVAGAREADERPAGRPRRRAAQARACGIVAVARPDQGSGGSLAATFRGSHHPGAGASHRLTRRTAAAARTCRRSRSLRAPGSAAWRRGSACRDERRPPGDLQDGPIAQADGRGRAARRREQHAGSGDTALAVRAGSDRTPALRSGRGAVPCRGNGGVTRRRHALGAGTRRSGVFVIRATRPATLPTSQPVTPRRP